jgi:VIT1/CCC1 family predicted Fe2+/Mn2+ transporter
VSRKKRLNSTYLRNIVFGAEDSLVSTVGFLFGLATAQAYNAQLLIIAGAVLITVEALSMGVGSYLTETGVEEFDHKKTNSRTPVIGGLLMFFSYVFFGMCVISPYIFISMASAKYVSVGITLVLLFLVGYLPTKSPKAGMRMLVMAGMAILVGFLVAQIF